MIPLAPLIPIFNAYTQVSKSQIIVLYNPIFLKMATCLHFFQNVSENTGIFFFWTARSFFIFLDSQVIFYLFGQLSNFFTFLYQVHFWVSLGMIILINYVINDKENRTGTSTTLDTQDT